jgi:hypothetical protein
MLTQKGVTGIQFLMHIAYKECEREEDEKTLLELKQLFEEMFNCKCRWYTNVNRLYYISIASNPMFARLT